MMNRARLRVRISSIIQYDNVRRVLNRAVFHPNFPPSRPETSTRTGNLRSVGRGYPSQANIQGHLQRLIHSSHQLRPAPRLEPGATLSPDCGWPGPRARPGGRWQDNVPARKAIVGGGQSAAENSSPHDFAACSRRTPQRADPTSARSTTPSWRRDQRLLESRRGDGR
jgi:hypothetical protein